MLLWEQFFIPLFFDCRFIMDLTTSNNLAGKTRLLLPIIEQGGLILTPNRRLSRRLLADIEQQLAVQGHQSWQNPKGLSKVSSLAT